MVLSATQTVKEHVPDIPPRAYAAVVETVVPVPVPETLEEKAKRIAKEHGISYEKFSNLIESESKWNPNAVNEKTGDYGVVQINLKSHPTISKEQALDPEFALTWAANEIKGGREWQWTVCNCYSLVKALLGKLPKMAAITPNSPPVVGGVAIFDYKGVKHVAYVKTLKEKTFIVREANFEPCLMGEREVSYEDRALMGFYAPDSS